jgi:SWIM zinc finger
VSEGKRIFQVESFTTPGIRYEIDLDRRTCTCPAFQKHPSQPCKHLLSIDGLFPQSGEPEPNEALSAFIKSIRLRRPGDAITWLLYLWRIPQYQARVQRRILIAAAEDNLSLGVMERVAAWYGSIARLNLQDAAREVYRICATPNWWAQPDGHAYIFAWEEAERAPSIETTQFLPEKLVRYTAARDVTGALKAFSALYGAGQADPRQMPELMLYLAARSGSEQANRLATVYALHARAFGVDANLTGQVIYACLTNRFADQAVPEVREDVETALQAAQLRLEGSLQVESWALAGR